MEELSNVQLCNQSVNNQSTSNQKVQSVSNQLSSVEDWAEADKDIEKRVINQIVYSLYRGHTEYVHCINGNEGKLKKKIHTIVSICRKNKIKTKISKKEDEEGKIDYVKIERIEDEKGKIEKEKERVRRKEDNEKNNKKRAESQLMELIKGLKYEDIKGIMEKEYSKDKRSNNRMKNRAIKRYRREKEIRDEKDGRVREGE